MPMPRIFQVTCRAIKIHTEPEQAGRVGRGWAGAGGVTALPLGLLRACACTHTRPRPRGRQRGPGERDACRLPLAAWSALLCTHTGPGGRGRRPRQDDVLDDLQSYGVGVWNAVSCILFLQGRENKQGEGIRAMDNVLGCFCSLHCD